MVKTLLDKVNHVAGIVAVSGMTFAGTIFVGNKAYDTLKPVSQFEEKIGSYGVNSLTYALPIGIFLWSGALAYRAGKGTHLLEKSEQEKRDKNSN